MSTAIDQKVVEMRFDNKQFETNAAATMSTLEKLTQSLNLTGAAKGFENVNSAAKGVNLSGLGNAVDTVQAKFSAMSVVAATALANITNSAVNAGKRMVSALTIDPVKTGLAEYETQINAVQTILANTEHKGTTMDQVNMALDELNKYADKTIYNFTEMTRNIGTFTAAGVDLDKSVTSIKGIANLAAVSGSTSQQASTAMYQLSQALATGTVKLMDWNSVVNAGMGGQVFQNALTRTAAVMAGASDDVEAWRQKNIEAHGSFRDSLTEGGWLTAEVLTETLTQLSGAYTEADLLAKGYSKEQAAEILKLADTAVDAATKVKTFTQLWDTLKEAAQSGWTQTWELIIGDFEQAKSLWTGVSDVIGEMINASADSRNKLLEGALTSNWDKLIKKVNEAGIETTEFEERVTKTAKKHGIDVDSMIKKYGSLEQAIRKGAISTDILKEAVGKIVKTVDGVDLSLVDKVLGRGAKGDAVNQVEAALKKLGYSLKGNDGEEYGGDGYFGLVTERAIKAFQEAQGLKITGIVDEKTLAALKEATGETETLTANIDDLVGGLDELGGRELLIESFKNIFSGVLQIIKPIKTAFTKIFPPITVDQLYNFIEGFHSLTEKFKLSMPQMRKIHQTFKGLFSILDIGWTGVKALGGGLWDLASSILPGLGNGILDVTGSIGGWLTGLRDSVKETDIFGKAVDGIVGFVKNAIEGLKEFGNFLKDTFTMSGLWSGIVKIGTKIAEVGADIGKAFSGLFSSENLSGGLSVFNGVMLGGALLSVKKFFNGLTEMTESSGLKGFLDNISGILEGLGGTLEAWQQNLKADSLMKIAKALIILAGAILILAMIDPDKLASSLGAITVLFGELMGSMAIFNLIGGSYKGALGAVPVMIGMATAILVLAGAVKTLSSIGWEGLMKGLVGVGVLMAEIAAFLKISSFNGKMFSTAAGMVLLAAAVKILASAVKDFAGLNWEEIGKGLAAVGGLLAELAIFTNLTGNAKHVISTGASLVLIAASMKILASAVKDFSGMSWEEIGKGLAGIAGSLLAVSIAMNLMPKNMLGMGVGLVVISGALLILGESIERMSGMSWDEIAKGLATLGGSMLILALGLNLMTGTLGGSAALIVAAGAVAMLTPALDTLGSMSLESIGKALLGLAGAFAVIGAAGLLLTPIIPAILSLAGAMGVISLAMLGLGAGVALIAGAVGVLAGVTAAGATAIVGALTAIIGGVAAMIPVVVRELGNGVIEFVRVIGESASAIGEAVKAIVLTLVDVLVECAPAIADGALKLVAAVLESLATYTPQIVNSLFDFLIGLIDGLAARLPELTQSIVDVFTEFFSGVIDAISGIDVGTLVSTVAGVGIMAGIMFALSAVTALVPGAMAGVLGLGAVVAELAVVLAAIGGLAQIPGLEWLIGEGADMMLNIGNAIGGFVGGIVGGIAEGFTASLPQIGTDLSTFMTNLQPFIDGAKTVDESMLTGVESIVGIISALTATSIVDSLTSWFTGGSSLTDFANELVPFGEAIKTFSDSVSGIDESAVTAATNAAATLAAVAATIPNYGGLVSFFAGENDMTAFGTQLAAFGTSIKDFATNVSGIDETAVTAAASAASILTTMANEIPNTGGLVSFFTGENDLATFGTNLEAFGTSMKNFSTNVSGIDEAAVTAAASAGSLMTELANTIPNTGGLVSFFTGDNDLATFGTQLVSFGTHMKSFSDEVNGINPTAVTAAATAGTALSNLANTIPDSGGLFAWFTGDNKMDTFGEQIVAFGTAIKKFGDSVVGINGAAIETGLYGVRMVIGIGVTVPEGGYPGLGTFGSQLETFGTKMKNFGDKLKKVDSDKMTTVITSFKTLAVTISDMADIDFSVLTSFEESLKNLGTDGVDSFVKAFEEADAKVTKAGKDMVIKLIKGAESAKQLIDHRFKTIGKNAASSLKSAYNDFYSAGKYLVQGFANGITANTFLAAAKAKAMASAALIAARAVLLIASPSKAFYKIGAFAGEGFVNALGDYASRAYSASAEMAAYARDGLTNAISGISRAIETGIDTQPTIRPVLDLSEVSAGAGSINDMFNMSPSLGMLSNVGTISSMMNARNQNGSNWDIISAIEDLGRKIGSMPNETYQINGVTYDDGSNISDAVKQLVRAARVERRI